MRHYPVLLSTFKVGGALLNVLLLDLYIAYVRLTIVLRFNCFQSLDHPLPLTCIITELGHAFMAPLAPIFRKAYWALLAIVGFYAIALLALTSTWLQRQ
jgi:hypothetical protein